MAKKQNKKVRTEAFDARAAWANEVEPLLKQVYEACKRNGIQCLLWTIQEAHIGEDDKGHITDFVGLHYNHACARSMRYIAGLIDGDLNPEADNYHEALDAITEDRA